MIEKESEKIIDYKMMSLGKKSIVVLYVYYIAISIAASIFASDIISKADSVVRWQVYCNFSACFSVIGSSIFYSRKLYKACIRDEYDFEEGSWVQRTGTFFFFFLRPAFAAIFAWITQMGWGAGVISSVDKFEGFSQGYLAASGIVGFFVGFLAGQILSRMESSGRGYMKGGW